MHFIVDQDDLFFNLIGAPRDEGEILDPIIIDVADARDLTRTAIDENTLERNLPGFEVTDNLAGGIREERALTVDQIAEVELPIGLGSIAEEIARCAVDDGDPCGRDIERAVRIVLKDNIAFGVADEVAIGVASRSCRRQEFPKGQLVPPIIAGNIADALHRAVEIEEGLQVYIRIERVQSNLFLERIILGVAKDHKIPGSRRRCGVVRRRESDLAGIGVAHDAQRLTAIQQRLIIASFGRNDVVDAITIDVASPCNAAGLIRGSKIAVAKFIEIVDLCQRRTCFDRESVAAIQLGRIDNGLACRRRVIGNNCKCKRRQDWAAAATALRDRIVRYAVLIGAEDYIGRRDACADTG